MKVLIVHSRYKNGVLSGENKAVQDQIDCLRASGHDVEEFIISSEDHDGKLANKMKLGFTVATGFGPSPLRAISDFKPDIVHIHNLFPNFGTAWIEEYDGPIIATVHNFRLFCAAGTLFRNGEECTLCPSGNKTQAIKNKCYRNSRVATFPLFVRSTLPIEKSYLSNSRVTPVFLSRRVLDTYESFGFFNANSKIVPNFTFQTTRSNVCESPSGWVFAGRLSPEKGILELMNHWPRGESLRVYGDGPLLDQVLKSQNNYIKYGGVLTPEQVAGTIQKAHGLIVPSIWREGAFPLVAQEAYSVGRPIVCLPNNSLADEVALGGGGVCIPNLTLLSEALQQIKSHADSYQRLVEKSYNARYAPSVWLKGIESVYNERIQQL